MIQINADFGALEKFVEDLVKREPEVKPHVFKMLQGVAKDLEERVKNEMPVDTGRAKASWGHFTPEHLTAGAVPIRTGGKTRAAITSSILRSGSAQTASEQDAVYEESPGDLVIFEGTRVPYVEFLNAGHSQQAPAGFIDRATEAMERELEVKAAEQLDLDFGELGTS